MEQFRTTTDDARAASPVDAPAGSPDATAPVDVTRPPRSAADHTDDHAGAAAAITRPDAPGPAQRLRVLHTLNPPDGTTRYVDQMLGGAGGDVDALPFTWTTALRGGYDVLHVHWPELLVRHPRPLRRAARHVALHLLLALLRVRRVPVVRTLHNTVPHESVGRAEARALAAVDAATRLYVLLTPATRAPGDAASVQIPLGHYRDAFAHLPRVAATPGRLVTIGLLRPYKGVEELLAAFTALPGDHLSLTVAGKPTPEIARVVEDAVARDPRITADLRFVPDATFVEHVTAAELVVLPYRQMTNSGVLVAALSLDRPCLVPASPANAALAAEVGEGWVLQYDGEFDAAVLADGLHRAATTPRSARPDLSARDWRVLGAAHDDAYRTAVALARGGARVSGTPAPGTPAHGTPAPGRLTVGGHG
ncbi:putative glycosyl transferase [Cellulomonas flavigena DSM 20109]|uniref:Putative glycosyl transferase n=1 Tax=Cellulomonas flavigena (strain ATCC 482 / DSM 20109 / BCRC 11376 / JCM 18109 / NBRC 3775 / NCIMB 8073 / NRS 134) TaxID=446466 RepID=D5UJD1_CELFN|nr:putative glycosyltransferase [Cellulomonas flavigena]ADG73654.1 putative glycosyl transferase [Cellulomonas flavigena DSM 20109]